MSERDEITGLPPYDLEKDEQYARARSDAAGYRNAGGDGFGGQVGRLRYWHTDGLHPTTQALADSLAFAFDEAYDLALRKQQAYGPFNILRSPGGALNGLRVRLSDKQARWNHMIDTGNPDLVNESLRETFMDALNYCAFAVLILDGTFPEQETTK